MPRPPVPQIPQPQSRWIHAVAQLPHPLPRQRKHGIAREFVLPVVRQVSLLRRIVGQVVEARGFFLGTNHEFVVSPDYGTPFARKAEPSLAVHRVWYLASSVYD
jgi:hypothetical protein